MKKLLFILILLPINLLYAQDHYVGEIRAFPFGVVPRGWAPCNGQLMPISQNTALFSLLGTQYGGDGRSTFALPDLNGKMIMGKGQGPGLSFYSVGEQVGSENVTLLVSEMPSHVHEIDSSVSNLVYPKAYSGLGNVNEPVNAIPAQTTSPAYGPVAETTMVVPVTMYAFPVGGSLPHNNLKPYVVINYCIALQGSFPPRQ